MHSFLLVSITTGIILLYSTSVPPVYGATGLICGLEAVATVLSSVIEALKLVTIEVKSHSQIPDDLIKSSLQLSRGR